MRSTRVTLLLATLLVALAFVAALALGSCQTVIICNATEGECQPHKEDRVGSPGIERAPAPAPAPTR